MRVREAVPEDWEHVKALLAELGRPDVRDDPDEPRHRARYKDYLERDDAQALESANWRESSHAFYEHVGWGDTGKAFSRALGDVQWPPAPR